MNSSKIEPRGNKPYATVRADLQLSKTSLVIILQLGVLKRRR